MPDDSPDTALTPTRFAQVAVLIPSIGRESVIRTVRSVAEAANVAVHRARVQVFVSDDSADGAADARLREAGRLGVAVEVLPVAAQNIAHARNAGLEAALRWGADFAAMIDDDEWAEPDWLLKLLEMADSTQADAVIGSVMALYPEGAPAWFVKLNPYTRIWGDHGADIRFGATGNALLRLSTVRDQTLRFDPALGRTGGEDTDFFNRLLSHGGRMVATQDAVVTEEAPLRRCTLAFLKLRAVRSGQTYARMETAGWALFARGGFYAGAAIKAGVALASSAAALLLLNRAKAAELYIRYWSNIGKLRELFGLDLVQNYPAKKSPPAPQPGAARSNTNA